MNVPEKTSEEEEQPAGEIESEPPEADPLEVADGQDSDGMVMPTTGENKTDQEIVIAAPPSVGRQLVQLIAIPAVICAIAVGGIWMLGQLMPPPDSIDTLLLRLRSSSGAGKIGMGLKDPRYQERCRAASSLAQMLPSIDDAQQRNEIGSQIIAILKEAVQPNEIELEVYLLMAIGQLGPEGGLTAITERLSSKNPMVRLHVARAISSWPDVDAARITVPTLVSMLKDEDTFVASEAARVLGVLATSKDVNIIQSLRESLGSATTARRELYWNASVALARLGDKEGSVYVAGHLLNRDALAKEPAASSGPMASKMMSAADQELVIISTLAAVREVADKTVLDRIKQLADNDPSVNVRKAAKQIITGRNSEAE